MRRADSAVSIASSYRFKCIDAHAHDDLALLLMPDMTPKISQGVTTVVAGNCGISLAPLAMPGVPPPPLDLLGSEPGWFRFEHFRGLRGRAA